MTHGFRNRRPRTRPSKARDTSCGCNAAKTAGGRSGERPLSALRFNIEWRDASGARTLYSYGMLHQVYHPRHEERLPLILANIDLAEGIRIRTSRHQPGGRQVGMALTVDFETLPDGAVIPVFNRRTEGWGQTGLTRVQDGFDLADRWWIAKAIARVSEATAFLGVAMFGGN